MLKLRALVVLQDLETGKPGIDIKYGRMRGTSRRRVAALKTISAVAFRRDASRSSVEVTNVAGYVRNGAITGH